MARIVCTSDLHLGITSPPVIRELVREIGGAGADAVVVCGDLGEPVRIFRACLDLLKPLRVPVGVIAGNHDLWVREGGDSDSARLFHDVLPRLVRDLGYAWLEEDALALPDGAAVTGTIAWYDYSHRSSVTRGWTPERFSAVKPEFSNDGHNIVWDYTDPGFAETVSDRLVSRLAQLSANSAVGRILVATHVPVFACQLTGRRSDDPVLESYYANLTLGKRLLEFPKIAAVVSGHTHRELLPVAIAAPGRTPLTVATLGSDYGAPRFFILEV